MSKDQKALFEKRSKIIALQEQENKLFAGLETDIVDEKKNAQVQWSSQLFASLPSDVRQRFAFRKKRLNPMTNRDDCIVRCLYMCKFQQVNHKLAQEYLTVQHSLVELERVHGACAVVGCNRKRESDKPNVFFCQQHRTMLYGTWKNAQRVRWWYHHNPVLFEMDQKQNSGNDTQPVPPKALGTCSFCKQAVSFYQASPRLVQRADEGGLADINNARPACRDCAI